jgi:uncharacterized protein
VQNKKKQTITVGLLVAIGVMLGAILIVLPRKGATDTVTESDDYNSTLPDTDIEVAPQTDVGEETVDVTETATGKPAQKKKLFVLIDDVGNSLTHLDEFLDIPVPITFAVMPGRPYSEESARRIIKAGFDIILHQPMEPVGDQDPGVGAILTSMEDDEITAILDRNLSGLPDMPAINNHMGSKATADVRVMTSVLTYLKKHGMFFVDSYTTGKSVAEEIARKLDMPYARRTALFLDNEGDEKNIEKAFTAGVDLAEQAGISIMIGHVHSGGLAKVIREMYVILEERGFGFYGITSLDS